MVPNVDAQAEPVRQAYATAVAADTRVLRAIARDQAIRRRVVAVGPVARINGVCQRSQTEQSHPSRWILDERKHNHDGQLQNNSTTTKKNPTGHECPFAMTACRSREDDRPTSLITMIRRERASRPLI